MLEDDPDMMAKTQLKMAPLISSLLLDCDCDNVSRETYQGVCSVCGVKVWSKDNDFLGVKWRRRV